jgi:hypothetical protein
MHDRLLPRRRGRNQRFDVELVGVEQQPHQRHLIVGFVADVTDYDYAGMTGKVVHCRERAQR